MDIPDIDGAEPVFIDRTGPALEPLAQGVVEADRAVEAERLRHGGGGEGAALLRPHQTKGEAKEGNGGVEKRHGMACVCSCC